MFGFTSVFQALHYERENLAHAEKNPLYHEFIGKIESEVVRVCFDRTYEDVSIEARVRPCMDVKTTHRLVKRAVNRKSISLGLHIRVTYDEKRCVITCIVPIHNIKAY